MMPFLSHLIAAALIASLASWSSAAAVSEEDEATRALLDGRALTRSGLYFEATAKLESALRRAEQTGQHVVAALILANIAEIQRFRGNASDAAHYYREALRRYRLIGHQGGVEITQKKIEELLGAAAPGFLETGREILINQAVERVRSRVQAREKERD